MAKMGEERKGVYYKNSFIAVRSAEEPFCVGQCLEDISNNQSQDKKFKIKWLERVAKKKNGTTYCLSYEDRIFCDNILTSIYLKRLSRFILLLDTKEETKISSLLSDTICNNALPHASINYSRSTYKKCEKSICSGISNYGCIDEAKSVNCNISNTTIGRTKILGSTFSQRDHLDYIEDENSYVTSSEYFGKTEKLNTDMTCSNLKGSVLNSIIITDKSENINTRIQSVTDPLPNYLQRSSTIEVTNDINTYHSNNADLLNYVQPSPVIEKTRNLSADYKYDLSDIVSSACNNTPKGNMILSTKEKKLKNRSTNISNCRYPINCKQHLPINEDVEIMHSVDHSSIIDLRDCMQQSPTSKELTNVTYLSSFIDLARHKAASNLETLHNTSQDSEALHDYSSSGSEYVPQNDSSEESDTYNYALKDSLASFRNALNKNKDTDSKLKDKIKEGSRKGKLSKTQKSLANTSKCVNANGKKKKSSSMSHSLSTNLEGSTHKIEIDVKCVKKTNEGKRVYDKRHNCYFCNKLVCKISRHLEDVHSQDIEVSRLLAFSPMDARRKEGFLCILRAGDYFYNCEVIAKKEGDLILSRRPLNKNFQKVSYKNYGPCPHCLGFFLLSRLWHHVKYNCPKKKTLTSVTMGTSTNSIIRDIRGESMALLSNATGEQNSDYFQFIINAFREDEVSDICKKDELIIKFGLLLFEKYNKHQYEYIRQTMRQLGRLLLAINAIKLSKISLQDSLFPKNFDTLIMAVKNLCLSQRSTIHQQDYGIPSLALKLGHSLRKCALVARGIALRKGDLQINKEMEAFLDLMSMEWNSKISCAALRTLQQRKINLPELLPLTDDLLILNKHLKEVITENIKKISIKTDPQCWATLAMATLCRVILFNKRRSGEASRMTINQYASRPHWKEQNTCEIKATLTPIENNLAERLSIVEVVGKSRALVKVPILLTFDMKEAIDKLIEKRIQNGISNNNTYVFARGNQSEGYLRGHDCLRHFCNALNLKKPRLITSTKLRKYIATVVQIFDLKENEYDWLARHLGHDIRVHRDFYRLHESAVELTKVSRILLAVEKGKASAFSGKSLADINVTDLPSVEDSDVTEGNSEDDLNDKEVEDLPIQVPKEHLLDASDNWCTHKKNNIEKEKKKSEHCKKTVESSRKRSSFKLF